jgi:hypothetical protein
VLLTSVRVLYLREDIQIIVVQFKVYPRILGITKPAVKKLELTTAREHMAPMVSIHASCSATISGGSPFLSSSGTTRLVVGRSPKPQLCIIKFGFSVKHCHIGFKWVIQSSYRPRRLEIEQLGDLNSFLHKRLVILWHFGTVSRQIPSKFDLSSQDDEVWVYCMS